MVGVRVRPGKQRAIGGPFALGNDARASGNAADPPVLCGDATPVRLLIVTGIYPPDVGGPATHAKELVDELTYRGHVAQVVSLWSGIGVDVRAGIVRFPRR